MPRPIEALARRSTGLSEGSARIDAVEDSRMQNVVSLRSDRPRPQRILGVPRSGARILFFTGVRYCRDEADAPGRPDSRGPCHEPLSGQGLDAAAH